MKYETIEHNNKLIFSVTIISCLIVSFLIAFWAAQSTNEWGVTVIFYVIFIIMGVPLGIILVLASIICFISRKNYKVYGFALLLSCLLLPIASFGFLKLMEAMKIAKYK